MRQVPDFKKTPKHQKKICMITCYDYPSAKIISNTDVDWILVGDSVAMVVHGHEHTTMATMDMMLLHTKAVARGAQHQPIITDLPFLCHRGSLNETIKHTRALIQAGAHAIKIEGGDEKTCRTIHHLTTSGIPIMGHIGLTPQAVLQLGGYRVQGKSSDDAERLMKEAHALEAAGCFAVVLECIPSLVAKNITEALSIPVIGIGAGVETDGQVLVWHDLLGLQTELKPRFVKQYLQGQKVLTEAIHTYATEVHNQAFPCLEHAFS